MGALGWGLIGSGAMIAIAGRVLVLSRAGGFLNEFSCYEAGSGDLHFYWCLLRIIECVKTSM